MYEIVIFNKKWRVQVIWTHFKSLVFFFQIDLYYPFNEIADKIRDLNM